MTESLDENMRGMGDPADYDAWARETPAPAAERLELLPDYSPIVMMEPTARTPAARGTSALTTALADLTADAAEGSTLEQVVVYGTYTDGRSGYAGNLRRTIAPNDLRELLDERRDLADKLAAATRAVASLAVQRDAMDTALGNANDLCRRLHEQQEENLRAARDMLRRHDGQETRRD
jgi:hypothetical protein